MVEAKLDEIRKQGYPVTLAELDKWYPQVPAGQNAADIYLQAFAKFSKWNTNSMIVKRDLLPIVGDAKLPPRTQALSDEVQSLIAEYLADNTESLRLLHEGASMRRCRYPVDLTSGFETPLPLLNDVRHGARLLTLKGILWSEEGNNEIASEAIVDGLCLGRSLEQEPTLISQLVRAACQGIALTGLERMLNRTAASDAELSRLAAAVSDAEVSQTMIRGYVGGISSYDSIFRMPVGKLTEWVEKGFLWLPIDTKKSYTVTPLIALYKVTGLMDVDHLSLLRGMEDYVGASRKPLPSRLRASESCSVNAEKLPRWHILSRMFLPSLHSPQVKEARAIAALRAAKIALAIERYRLAKSGLPDSPDDLVPKLLDAVPSDPFDGQSMRYKKLEKGYVVYSVGEDGKDDGGDEKKDITFTVER